MQVGTSSQSPVSRGTDYAFISELQSESPRIALSIDWPLLPAETRASPRRDQSLQGHAPCGAEGFPRHCPSSIAFSFEAAGVGFAVMSGSSHGIAPVQGNYSPDKEFRYLRQDCYYPPTLSEGGGTVISAVLPTSPRGSDCIFTNSN